MVLFAFSTSVIDGFSVRQRYLLLDTRSSSVVPIVRLMGRVSFSFSFRDVNGKSV